MQESSPYAPCRRPYYMGPSIEPGDPASLGEAGSVPLVEGQQDYDIVFETVKANTNYDVEVSFSIPTGATPQTFQWFTSNETTTGMRISLATEPVTGDAMPIMKWRVAIR